MSAAAIGRTRIFPLALGFGTLIAAILAVEVLIRAFAKIKARVPGAKLLIGGKASGDVPMLEALAKSGYIERITNERAAKNAKGVSSYA